MTSRARLVERWDAFWFEPDTATNLAVCRFVFFLGMYHFSRGLTDEALDSVTSPAAFHFPINIFRYVPELSPHGVVIAGHVLAVALLCAAFGVATRLSTIASFVLYYYLATESSSYSKLVHPYLPFIWISGFLMLSRAGDALSVDALIRRRWSKWPFGAAETSPSSAYRWPVQLACVHVVVVYVMNALSKLRYAGLHWVSSENMVNILRPQASDQGCRPQLGGPATTLKAYLVDHPSAAQAVAIVLLVIGLTAPLALLRGWIRYACLIGFVTFEVFWFSVIGRFNDGLVLACIFFLPWNHLGALALRAWARVRPRGM